VTAIRDHIAYALAWKASHPTDSTSGGLCMGRMFSDGGDGGLKPMTSPLSSPRPRCTTEATAIAPKEEEAAIDDEYERLMARWGQKRGRAATSMYFGSEEPPNEQGDRRASNAALPTAPPASQEVASTTFARARPEALAAPKTSAFTPVEAAK
jgi:hypothetical protein